MKLLLLLIVIILALPGCAANMAAQGQNGPDMNIVQKQHTRADVERMLGSPVRTIRSENGQLVDLYRVEARTEPNLTRATGHAAVSLFSFGLWELVGGPIEAYQARRLDVLVQYDESDKVVSITSKR